MAYKASSLPIVCVMILSGILYGCSEEIPQQPTEEIIQAEELPSQDKLEESFNILMKAMAVGNYQVEVDYLPKYYIYKASKFYEIEPGELERSIEYSWKRFHESVRGLSVSGNLNELQIKENESGSRAYAVIPSELRFASNDSYVNVASSANNQICWAIVKFDTVAITSKGAWNLILVNLPSRLEMFEAVYGEQFPLEVSLDDSTLDCEKR